MIVYTEDPQDDTKKKLLEVVNEFSKVAGYKMNIQKYVVFLYTNNELSERDTKETIPLHQNEEKHLWINLTKEVKDLYSDKYKTQMKESEDNTNRWKNIPCSSFGSIDSYNDYHTIEGSLEIQCNLY